MHSMDYSDIITELKSFEKALPAACTDCSSHCPPHRVHPKTQSTVNQTSPFRGSSRRSESFRHRESLQKTVQ